MIPSIGRIVHYTLGKHDAAEINRRREDARVSGIARENTGVVVHIGNSAREGDVYPLVITRVWADHPEEGTSVNGQVLLDGNDSLWVTSRCQGDGPCYWHAPPRV